MRNVLVACSPKGNLNAFVKSKRFFSPNHRSNEAKKDPLCNLLCFQTFDICPSIQQNVRHQSEQFAIFNFYS